MRFLLTPIRMQVLTRVLPPADYGMLTLLSMSAHALAMVLSAGGFELLLRRLPYAGPIEQDGILRSVLMVSTSLGLVACGLTLLGAVPALVPSSGPGGVSRAATAALFLLFLHMQQRLYYLLGCRRYLAARTTHLLWSDLWFLALVPWGLGTFVKAEVAAWAWCAWLLLVIALTWRWVPLGRALTASGREVPLGRMLAIGLPMVPAVMAEWTFRLVGQYVLLARTDAATMALYALTFNIAGIGYVVGVPLIDSMSAEFNAAQGEAADPREPDALRMIVSRTVRFILAVSVPVGLAFVFLPGPLVRLLAGPAFAPAAELLPWAALVPFLLLTNLLLARLLLASGRSPAVGTGSVAGAAVALGLCVLWVDPHGPRGLLLATTAGLAATTLLMAARAPVGHWFHARELRWWRLAAGGILLTACFAALGSPDALPLLRLAVAGGVTLAVAIGFGWLRRSDFPADSLSRSRVSGEAGDE
jgi:O-antigen/teichoic acid export membrane protein